MARLMVKMIGISCVLQFSLADAMADNDTIKCNIVSPNSRQIAPAFRLLNARGKRVSLSDFAGKPVLLNFWATECGGCQAELPTFIQMDRRYKAKGLVTVGISADIMWEDLKSAAEGWAHVTPFVKAKGIGYSILLDDGGARKAYGPEALPATYLIDRSGRIAATYIGVVDPGNLEANVKYVLAEQ